MRYENIKSIIPNTQTEQMIDEKTNELVAYRITPAEGYKLHSNSYDEKIIDPITLEPTESIKLGYIHFPDYVQICHNYDFENNPDLIYAVPDVNPEQIAE